MSTIAPATPAPVTPAPSAAENPVGTNPLRPGMEAELVTYLAGTIGVDVETEMTRRGWMETPEAPVTPEPQSPPEAPPVVTTPVTPAPIVETPPPVAPVVPPVVEEFDLSKIDWESLRGADGLIAKKWKDPAAATQGVHAMIHTNKAILAERDTLRNQLAAAPTVTTPSVATPVAPVPSAREAVLAKFTEKYEIDASDLNDLFNTAEEAGRSSAQAVVQAKDQDAQKWAAADAFMQQTYPEALQHSEEIQQWVRAHPEVAADVQGLMLGDNRIGAMKYAWLAFKDANHIAPPTPVVTTPSAADQQAEIDGLAQEQARREAVEKARLDAGLVSSSVSGVHAVALAGPSPEEKAAAIRAHRAGHGQPYRDMTFGAGLTGPLFDGSAP